MADNYTKRKIPVKTICEDVFGGNYNPSENTCTLLEQPEMFDRSISDAPKYTFYYVTQIFFGTAISFFGVFWSITLVPPFWYVNLILLIVSAVGFVYLDWYRESSEQGDITESLRRFFVLFPTYVIISILVVTAIEFGTIFNWKYWNFFTFLTADPVVATTRALFVGGLLNVFLIPKAEIVQILSQNE